MDIWMSSAMQLGEMIGKPIVSADSGDTAGRIDDVLLDGTRHHAVGILVSDGMFSKQAVLPFAEVQTVGEDAVIVRTLSTMRNATDWIYDGHPAHRARSVRGKAVVTADGARVGTLLDLVAAERTGEIIALEIATAGSGARRTRPALVHTVGHIQLTNDVVVIPQDVAGTRVE
jgi:uncharacterized protein YrrD